jgi:hypothetical protein
MSLENSVRAVHDRDPVPARVLNRVRSTGQHYEADWRTSPVVGASVTEVTVAPDDVR